MFGTMSTSTLRAPVLSTHAKRLGRRAIPRRNLTVSQAENSSRCWQDRVAQTAAPLLVALATAGPVYADNMFNIQAPASNPPLLGAASKVQDFSRDNKTEVLVKANLTENQIKLFYMAFGAFFVYGCCYFGSSTDPFYDTDEYRADGGDGTQHWFYNVAEQNEEQGREKIFQGLTPNPEDPDDDEYSFVRK